jgi:hypothetical protein
MGDRSHFATLGENLLKQIDITFDGVDVGSIFQEVIKDVNFTRLDRFCFLIAALITWFGAKKKKA